MIKDDAKRSDFQADVENGVQAKLDRFFKGEKVEL